MNCELVILVNCLEIVMMNKDHLLENLHKVRVLLDDVYYWAEGSDNPDMKAIESLTSAADTCVREAEENIKRYFGE